jgi:tRNA(Ile)-lysidine synthase TilS/MesJ
MPGRKLDFYQGFLERGRPVFAAAAEKDGATLRPCATCGMPTSQEVCGVCRIREAING